MTKQLKSGVQIYGIQPEMVVVDMVVASVFQKFNYDCITTSAVGKKHGTRSLHPVGFAKDYRSKHLADNDLKRQVLKVLQDSLPQCDIVLEHLNERQEHYHVEFDPKDDPQFQEDKLYYRRTGKWRRTK